MKWRIYSTPEFIKRLTCKSLMDEEEYNKYRKFEYGMFVFTDWVTKKLDEIYRKEREFIPNQTYTLELTAKDDIETIKEFCQFYIRMRRDPMTGKCIYADKLNIPQKISSECFEFVNRPLTFDTLNAVAFVITRIHVGKLSTDRPVDAYVNLQCMSYR